MKDPNPVQPDVVRTPNFAVFTREHLDALALRLSTLERVNAQLRARVEQVDNHLHRALHELAIEKGKEPHYFIRTWNREATRRDEEVGLTIERS